eukprot:gene8671-9608_t
MGISSLTAMLRFSHPLGQDWANKAGPLIAAKPRLPAASEETERSGTGNEDRRGGRGQNIETAASEDPGNADPLPGQAIDERLALRQIWTTEHLDQGTRYGEWPQGYPCLAASGIKSLTLDPAGKDRFLMSFHSLGVAFRIVLKRLRHKPGIGSVEMGPAIAPSANSFPM